MNPIDKQLMMGMIDILNNHSDILSEDQIALRLEDLKQFEDETNFIFMNSPTCKDIRICGLRDLYKGDFNKCSDIKSVVKFVKQKEVLAYLNLTGDNIRISYVDDTIRCFEVDTDNDDYSVNFNKIGNLPYKINQKEKYKKYIVSGILTPDLKFYVTNVIIGSDKTMLKDKLEEAAKLGFDVVPHWFIPNLNPKTLQQSIDYVFDYAEEEGLSCDGIVFRFNNTKHSTDRIIYEKSE